MESSMTETLRDALSSIAGAEIESGFGEPFITVFRKLHATEEESAAAGYICSLFLSSLLEGFPTGKLHTFVRYTADHCSRFSFNCSMYENVFSAIPHGSLCKVLLVNGEGAPCWRECSKQDIFEAFDFYTNR